MSRDEIVALLIQECNRLSRAIEALGGRGRNGRAAKNSVPIMKVAVPKQRRPLSAATRRKMALGQKKRWAAIKAAKK